jgi:hypothetical protein
MITLLISVGALLVAVIGRAALDPQPIVHAETAAPDVATSGYGVADDGCFLRPGLTTTKCPSTLLIPSRRMGDVMRAAVEQVCWGKCARRRRH